MASNAFFLFTDQLDRIAKFYTDVLLFPDPTPESVNGKKGLIFKPWEGTLYVRPSSQAKRPTIEERISHRLSEGQTLEFVEQGIAGHATEISKGKSRLGLSYIDLTDPVGVKWRIFEWTR